MVWNEQAMLAVCRKFSASPPEGVVFEEPYLPYVPAPWNGVLVLAEAQHLAAKTEGYVNLLKELSPSGRMDRLGRIDENVGVGPWDAGDVKLALKAMLPGIRVKEVAVSNASVWSKEYEGRNVNPTRELEKKSAQFWSELFAVWKPDLQLLVLLGNVAKRVMTAAGVLERQKHLKLRLPSPNLSIPAALFDPNDLFRRYPEVHRAEAALGMRLDTTTAADRRKIFFACHAVSVCPPEVRRMFSHSG